MSHDIDALIECEPDVVALTAKRDDAREKLRRAQEEVAAKEADARERLEAEKAALKRRDEFMDALGDTSADVILGIASEDDEDPILDEIAAAKRAVQRYALARSKIEGRINLWHDVPRSLAAARIRAEDALDAAREKARERITAALRYKSR